MSEWNRLFFGLQRQAIHLARSLSEPSTLHNNISITCRCMFDELSLIDLYIFSRLQNIRSKMCKVLSINSSLGLGATRERSSVPSRVLLLWSMWPTTLDRRAVCDGRRAGFVQESLLRDGWIDNVKWWWDEPKKPLIIDFLITQLYLQMDTTAMASTKTNQNESERRSPRNSFKCCRPTSIWTATPMDKISSESPTWRGSASEWHKCGFKTVELVRKSIKTHATATDLRFKPSFQSYHPTFAWQQPSRRPRETRLFGTSLASPHPHLIIS